jgi:hypothetical protein
VGFALRKMRRAVGDRQATPYPVAHELVPGLKARKPAGLEPARVLQIFCDLADVG